MSDTLQYVGPMPKHAQITHSVRLPLLGTMYLVAEAGGLVSFSSSRPEYTDEGEPADQAAKAACDAVISQAEKELVEYLEGRRTIFTVPLAPRGTAFQLLVWLELLRIPYGQTSTYGEVAQRLGGLHLARAVGHAAACNHLPIFIPCHRLTAKGGRTGGFSLFCESIGGPNLKERLLAMEQRLPANDQGLPVDNQDLTLLQ